MLEFFRGIGGSGRKELARRRLPPVRLALEQLECRALPAPLTPTGLVATGVSSSAIALTWNSPPDPSITGYDVFAKIWVPGSHGGKGSPSGGHYSYVLVASNLTDTSATVTGLTTGSFHTYVVTAVNAMGQSPYSDTATGETWVAPSMPYGSATFLLSSGALWSGPVNVTAGLTTQLTLLVSGNPLTYSILAGPSTASIDPNLGVVTYTPDLSEVGAASITIEISNSLGAVTQTIPFNVAIADPMQATPTLTLNGTTVTYNGGYFQAWATAVGTDGVTPVAGTFTFAYNGTTALPHNPGTYGLLATFTSYDPNYGNATVLDTFTVNKATPAFSNLSSPTIAVGASTTTVSGNLAVNAIFSPTGRLVIVTLNGAVQEARVDAAGNFSASFATDTLPVGSYALTYSFAGDSYFNAADMGSDTLNVLPLAAPAVTLDPTDLSANDGTLVTFTAAASGIPAPVVQWQVSTDGGTTFTDIAGATNPTLIFIARESQNGYRYRAVFTNVVGSVTSMEAILTVLSDDGG
jgi:Fibronectin type III domain